MKIKTLTGITFLLITIFTVQADTVKKLGNLNKIKNPESFIISAQAGDKFFLTRFDDDHGGELWITDGTPAGTVLLKDINPGPGHSLPFMFAPAKFAGVDGIYFTADDGTNGRELWKSDGTPGGTVMVKNIDGGNGNGMSLSGFSSSKIIVQPGTSKAVFVANDGVNGGELWYTDGSNAGTNIIGNIAAGAASSDPENFYFDSIHNLVFFSATSPLQGREPYAFQFSLAPPIVTLGDINPGVADSDPANFRVTVDGSKFIFDADDGVNGRELWANEGNPFSTLVSDITPGPESTYFGISEATSTQNLIGIALINDMTIGGQIIKTDGTPAGTSVVENLDCIPGGILAIEATGFSNIAGVVNDKVIFPCLEYFKGISRLWVSDGTEAGTKTLKNTTPGLPPIYNVFFSGDNRFLYFNGTPETGMELWSTNGKSAGTKILGDLNPGEASSLNEQSELSIYSLIFAPQELENSTASIIPITIGKRNVAIYTDGKAENTRVLFEINDDSNGNSFPAGFTKLGDRVLFAAYDTLLGNELFSTNGTKAGTGLLLNLLSGGSSNPRSFLKMFNKDKVLFIARDHTHGYDAWVTDGSKAGTFMLKNTYPDSTLFSDGPEILDVRFKSKYLMIAATEDQGEELWITNGTKRGTKLLKDIYPGNRSSGLESFAKLGNQAFFAADDGVHGSEVWVTNGKAAGTNLFLDIVPGASDSYPDNFTVVGDSLFFTAETAANGKELWISDGTPGGTSLLKDIFPGATGSSIELLTKSGDILFFIAETAAEGQELWRSDGTPAGTFMVEDINPGASDSNIEYLVSLAAGVVTFKADDGIHGFEIFKSGSSLGSAELIADIFPGANSSYPEGLYKIPGKNLVYFSAEDGINGKELWRTSGSAADTVLVKDIASGIQSSSPRELAAFGKKLYFSASTLKKGQEPYVARIP